MLRSALLLSLLGLCATACGGGPLVISGRVFDDQGTAISKAEVVTNPETDIAVTNQQGYFSLRQQIDEMGDTKPLSAGTYVVQIRKFGYEDVSIDVKLEKGELKLPDIVMEPRTLDVGDAAPDVTEERALDTDEGSTPTSGI